MAEREPLGGGKGTRYARDLIGGRRRPWRITASSYGNWTIEPLQLVEGYADGGIEAAQIAAEDAARVFVGALAAALGGRVVWGDHERVCRWTDSPDGDGWTAACGWGCWMLPADATDQTRNGFCGGCGGRIETTDAGEGGE